MVGDPVKKGEPILEIETDKVLMEVGSKVAGILLAILEEAGAVVPVIQTMAVQGARVMRTGLLKLCPNLSIRRFSVCTL